MRGPWPERFRECEQHLLTARQVRQGCVRCAGQGEAAEVLLDVLCQILEAKAQHLGASQHGLSRYFAAYHCRPQYQGLVAVLKERFIWYSYHTQSAQSECWLSHRPPQLNKKTSGPKAFLGRPRTCSSTVAACQCSAQAESALRKRAARKNAERNDCIAKCIGNYARFKIVI